MVWTATDEYHQMGYQKGQHQNLLKTLPKTRVVRINDRVQYSSHVVNIVAPYDAVLASGTLQAGDRVFSYSDVAVLFYEHFRDDYEELARLIHPELFD